MTCTQVGMHVQEAWPRPCAASRGLGIGGRMEAGVRMQVTLEVPEEIARAMTAAKGPLDRVALEGLAAEGYRIGLLSESQVQRLLGMASRFTVHDWLRERQIPY